MTRDEMTEMLTLLRSRHADVQRAIRKNARADGDMRIHGSPELLRARLDSIEQQIEILVGELLK